MRTELRKVTVAQEVYIANDGKEFDDEDDCQAYEANLLSETLTMRNYVGVKTNNLDNCQAVKLDRLSDIMSFIALCKYEGISHTGIDEPGVYMYTEGRYGSANEAWTNISKIVKSFDESEDTVSGN
jgi:hypothetical protein